MPCVRLPNRTFFFFTLNNNSGLLFSMFSRTFKKRREKKEPETTTKTGKDNARLSFWLLSETENRADVLFFRPAKSRVTASFLSLGALPSERLTGACERRAQQLLCSWEEVPADKFFFVLWNDKLVGQWRVRACEQPAAFIVLWTHKQQQKKRREKKKTKATMLGSFEFRLTVLFFCSLLPLSFDLNYYPLCRRAPKTRRLLPPLTFPKEEKYL